MQIDLDRENMDDMIFKAVGKGSIFQRYLNYQKIVFVALCLALGFCIAASAQTKEPVNQTVYSAAEPHYTGQDTWQGLKGALTFYMTNDMGRNGYYDQKPIAELMGWMAGTVDPECVLAVGDIHHFNGIASVSDPLWTTNYETIYSHPDLMIDWFPVCGNHEYRGNTQAFLDYSKVSRRWMMPSRYYTKVFTKKGVSVRIVFLDTTPLIDKYRMDTATYPDAVKQDKDAELAWLDETLKNAKEDWVVVVGHHPIYGHTFKTKDELTDMQSRVLPILHKYNNVDIYACGHIHNFQHLRMKGDNIDYVINSSSSLPRPVEKVEGTVFCSPLDGFSVITADKQELRLSMINKEGNIIHTVTRTKS